MQTIPSKNSETTNGARREIAQARRRKFEKREKKARD